MQLLARHKLSTFQACRRGLSSANAECLLHALQSHEPKSQSDSESEHQSDEGTQGRYQIQQQRRTAKQQQLSWQQQRMSETAAAAAAAAEVGRMPARRTSGGAQGVRHPGNMFMSAPGAPAAARAAARAAAAADVAAGRARQLQQSPSRSRYGF